MKSWKFSYSYLEPTYDTFACEAETEDEAQEQFDQATSHLDEVSLESISESDYISPDPNQMELPIEQEYAVPV